MSFVMGRTLEEVMNALESGALPVAGGTDLYVRLRRETDEPDLVGLERIPGLGCIEMTEDCLSVGGGVTWQQVIDSPEVFRTAPLLVLAARQVGGPAIRHMGTVGGNLCTASPAGDGLAALWALEAEVELVSREGSRVLPLEEFVKGPGITALKKGELLKTVRVSPTSGLSPFFHKVGKRKALAIGVGSLAALWCSEGGKLRNVRLVFGSMGPRPVRALEAEALLEGAVPEEKAFRAVAEICCRTVNPIDDVRASAQYRRRLAGGLVEMFGLHVRQELMNITIE